MKVKFYAALRQIVGGPVVEMPLAPGDTIRSVLTRLTGRWPGLGEAVWDESGQLSNYVHVFFNSREVKRLPDKLDTLLRETDVLDVFPPVAGGRGES